MTFSAGTRLGPYEILSPLGAGGMGEVYRARDTKLQRDVAIKVLPQVVASNPETLARFEREALAVASLSHPNILAIYDFGNDGGVAYAVMELLEGGTLRGKLDAGPIPQKQALDYALQIARGLSAAHQKGVVHRDLKPENLFVTKDGHLKILDFGLAKKVGAALPGEETSAPTVSGHTEPGVVMGTVGYMSPEQVRGLPVDHRSDIFSFGTILYELLSGRRAFKKQTAADTMSAILKEEPPELTGTGPALDHIVRHCLEKDRDDRFQSAKDVAFALGETSSFSVASDEPMRPPTGKRRLLIGIAAVVLIALAAISLLRRPPGGAAPAETVKRVAVLPFENLGAPEDDYFSDGISDEIRGKLTSLPGVQVIARGSSTPYKKSPKTPRQIARELDVAYLLTATVRWDKSGSASRVHVSPELTELNGSGAPISKWQQPFDAALTDVFRVQSDIATRVAQALGVALSEKQERRLEAAPTRSIAAYDAFLKGEEFWKSRVTGSESVRKALGSYEEAVALDPGFAVAWARVCDANLALIGFSDPMPERPERARVAAEKSVALARDRPEGYVALGNYWLEVKRDRKAAVESYGAAERIAPESVDVLLAKAYLEGNSEAAIADYRRAERLDPRSVLTLLGLGQTLCSFRRYPEAREVFDRGLAVAPTHFWLIEWKMITFLGEANLAGARGVVAAVPREMEPTTLVAGLANYLGLGFTLDETQRDLLLRLTPSAFEDDRGSWGLALAEASYLKGDAAKVRFYAEEARKAIEEQVRMIPGDGQTHGNLGIALAYLGRKEEAMREGQKAVALSTGRGSGFFQGMLVEIYVLVGEPEKALDQLEPLLKVGADSVLSPGWLKVDPGFDPLRSNPRFQKLIASAN